MKKLPLFFGNEFGYLRTQSSFESIDLMLNVSIALSYLFFHAGILLLHAFYEVGIEQFQESLHVVESAF